VVIFFDMDWVIEVKLKAENEVQYAFGDMNSTDLFNVVEHAMKKMRRLQFSSLITKEIEE
jgi:hypothetical protein